MPDKLRLLTAPPGPGCVVTILYFIQYLTVWGVEPVVTHQTSWLRSTGVCGVRQTQAGGSSVLERACTRKVSQP